MTFLYLIITCVVQGTNLEFSFIGGVPAWLQGIIGPMGLNISQLLCSFTSCGPQFFLVLVGLYGAKYYKPTPLLCSSCCNFLGCMVMLPFLLVIYIANCGGVELLDEWQRRRANQLRQLALCLLFLAALLRPPRTAIHRAQRAEVLARWQHYRRALEFALRTLLIHPAASSSMF